MKEIVIGNQKFNISCHASAYHKYADAFGRNIMQDINTVGSFLSKQFELSQKYTKEYLSKIQKDLSKISEEESQELLDKTIIEVEEKVFADTVDKLDEFIECLTKLTWICIYDSNKKIQDYETWYSNLETLKIKDDWVMEVVEVATNCFR